MKTCKRCGRSLPLSSFYKTRYGQGTDSVCKECRRAAIRTRYFKQIQDPSFIEKERERGKNKYHRLYKGKKSNKAIIKAAKYSSLRNAKRDFQITCSSDMELHHWNYNVTNEVILLERRVHHLFHATTTLNVDEGIYYVSNQSLDTLDKHLEVIKKICSMYAFDYSKVQILRK